MNEISLFNSPLFLGFDRFERLLDSLAKAEDSYPPYNIEVIGEDGFRITIALAGFKEKDLSVSLEENKLVVRGKQEDNTDKVYLHRGLAARRFVKTFILADNIEIKSASFDDGLLYIDLVQTKPVAEPKFIKIHSKRSQNLVEDCTLNQEKQK